MKLFHKKRNLIRFTQENAIVCDNPSCDYTVKNIDKTKFQDVLEYVNKPCPLCGENLLSEQDYKIGRMMEKYIMFVNKYFSWMTVFMNPEKEKVGTMHVKDGVNVDWEEK